MNRPARHIILNAIYLIAISMIVLSLGKLYAYFNVGADRRSMMDDNFQNLKSLKVSSTWKATEDIDGRLSPEAQKQLADHFMEAIRARQISSATGDTEFLIDHFTDDLLTELETFAQAVDPNERIHEQSMSHHLSVKFLSEDGMVALIEDSASYEVARMYTADTIRDNIRTRVDYRAMLLLQDGRWRIRHLQQLRRDLLPPVKPIENIAAISSIRGINYYPMETPWQMFGADFDSSIIASDFETIRKLRMNTLRIFVPYEDFGGAEVDGLLLRQLEQILDLASASNLKVVLTFFDMYGDYALDNWPQTWMHLETLLRKLSGHPAILAFDIKNEPDLDFDARGRKQVLLWLDEMIYALRTIDTIHPVTIGWSSATAALNLESAVDFVSFHHYTDPSTLEPAYDMLTNKIRGKPIVLGEFGYSSYSGLWRPFGSKLESQVTYYQEMFETIELKSLPWMVWTLHDFSIVPPSVVGRLPWRRQLQMHFGLHDLDGKPKPALDIIQAAKYALERLASS